MIFLPRVFEQEGSWTRYKVQIQLDVANASLLLGGEGAFFGVDDVTLLAGIGLWMWFCIPSYTHVGVLFLIVG